MMQVDYETRIDFDRMREYRVNRIKHYMDEFDIDCLLLFDTGNKRYSTSTAVCSPEIDNMGRYAIIPRNGPPHIFGFGSEVAAEKLNCPWIADYTFPAHGTMFGALPEAWGCSDGFLKDLDMVLGNFKLDKSKIRIGVDVIESQILLAMQANGYAAFHRIACEIRPGAKENDLQAVASHEMHRLGAQWIHNVQVTSGNRTNPHPHLSSDRLLQPGDIIFMDIVCLYNGYHTCVYRCFTVGSLAGRTTARWAHLMSTKYSGCNMATASASASGNSRSSRAPTASSTRSRSNQEWYSPWRPMPVMKTAPMA
jgi:Xaa-Pro dipeptidase